MVKFKTKYGIINTDIPENIGMILAIKENLSFAEYTEKYNLPQSRKDVMIELLKRKDVKYI